MLLGLGYGSASITTVTVVPGELGHCPLVEKTGKGVVIFLPRRSKPHQSPDTFTFSGGILMLRRTERVGHVLTVTKETGTVSEADQEGRVHP